MAAEGQRMLRRVRQLVRGVRLPTFGLEQGECSSKALADQRLFRHSLVHTTAHACLALTPPDERASLRAST